MKSIFIAAFMIYILWVVLYLLWERFFRRPGKQRQVSPEPLSENTDDNDIMGKSTFDLRHTLPEATKPENQKNGIQKEDSFAAPSEVKPPVRVPDKELDETFSHNRDDNQPMGISVPLEYDSNSHGDNLSEEEDEESWIPGNITLAEGSTFEEMGAADTINRYTRMALISLKTLPERKIGSSNELDLTLGDIEAFAAIGNYYAEKIRGACSLALYNYYGLKQDQEDAIQHLTNAKSFWVKYASIYDSQYKPSLLTRIGFVNIPELTAKTEQDIQIAKSWAPGTIKEYKKGKIAMP